MAKKRTNGEGSYSQRADGRWCWKMMDGYTPEGKPNTIVIYGKTQKEVKEKVKQYLRDKEDGLKIDRKLTFSAWADTWFESLSGVEESTKEVYRYTVRKRLLPDLNAVRLREKKARGYPAPRRGELYP